jgi:hypothetical protein
LGILVIFPFKFSDLECYILTVIFLRWDKNESTWHIDLFYQPRMTMRLELSGEWYGRRNCRLIHHKPTRPDLGSNLGRRDGKPATNRLSYGTAPLNRSNSITEEQDKR